MTDYLLSILEMQSQVFVSQVTPNHFLSSPNPKIIFQIYSIHACREIRCTFFVFCATDLLSIFVFWAKLLRIDSRGRRKLNLSLCVVSERGIGELGTTVS